MSVLTTESGNSVPELVFNAGMFLDRTTVIYGPSGTGKTVFVKHIMKLLDGIVDQILIVSPTEPSNRSYKGFVDPTLIHYSMSIPDPADSRFGSKDKNKKDSEVKKAMRFLETIWNRQEMMSATYERANRIETLYSIYSRLSLDKRKEGDRHIALLEKKRRRATEDVCAQYVQDQGRRADQTKILLDKFKKMLRLIYKKYITPHVDMLWTLGSLSEDERFSLQYLNFNPHLLLIFDDCAATLKPFFNKDVFRKLFYQNRHSHISVIICCQDDTDLPTNLRKNTYVSIFTDAIVSFSNFERSSNNFIRSTRDLVNEVVPLIFSQGFRKLAYIRDDDSRQHFYHASCPYPTASLFGSKALRELCDSVREEGSTMDTDNPFYSRFQVQA
jgi:hypothetical protein